MNRQPMFLGAPVGVWVNSGKMLQISYRKLIDVSGDDYGFGGVETG